jgi:hypothetical protein
MEVVSRAMSGRRQSAGKINGPFAMTVVGASGGTGDPVFASGRIGVGFGAETEALVGSGEVVVGIEHPPKASAAQAMTAIVRSIERKTYTQER